MNSSHALSWQTAELTFRNMSLSQIRQRLERFYGTEVLMFNEVYKRLKSRVRNNVPPTDEVIDEIRLVLYMNYDLLKDRLTIRGLRLK